VIGSPALAGVVAQTVFFGLVGWGAISGRLGIRGIVASGIAWAAAFLFAGLFFSPAVAVLDIVLVFVVVRGDIRLT